MNSINKDWVANHIDSNGEVVIPDGVEKIEAQAFAKNDKVKKVVMPDSVVEIGEQAFYDCTNLQEIEFSNNLKNIADNAFQGCTSLKQNIDSSHELAEKIRNKQASYEDVFKWCEENVDTVDFSNSDQMLVYDSAIRFMMNSRITRLTENEATVMIKYLSKSYLNEKGLSDRATVHVLDWETFIKRHKSDQLNAMCSTLKGTRFIVDYSPNVIKGLTSNNTNKFLDSLKTIYHEIAHVIQESSIKLPEINGNKVHYIASLYEIALENTARIADTKFYEENYSKLVLENQANRVRINKRISSYKKICTTIKKIL